MLEKILTLISYQPEIQRAKIKKVQRKSKTDGEKGNDKDKDDKIKQESPGSDYIIDSSYGQPLNPNLPFSPDG